MVGNKKEHEQSFAPRIHSVEGATVEFSRRDAPEVDITVPDYLLCVNFNLIRNAVYADSLTTMLEVHLLRQHSDLKQPRQQRTSLAPHKLAVITDYIQTHLDQNLRLSELANLADMSPFHFSRCFKQATGLSPSRYILAKRVEFVQHELAHTDRPLLELSLAAGFSSQSHMTSVFKQAVGLSPGEFRTQYH